eukprot:scaffold5231_cov119-Isochrysis_galbana.AAC.10
MSCGNVGPWASCPVGLSQGEAAPPPLRLSSPFPDYGRRTPRRFALQPTRYRRGPPHICVRFLNELFRKLKLGQLSPSAQALARIYEVPGCVTLSERSPPPVSPP